ncbi:uncharacterized protein LOC117303932 [Asterias rubens]|uniref:uncharacterized protein LOC117303932 n=1 Tax=Asterias rubens TaxID=7604 RepID=UPI0014550E5B|nr:uncharacterized protein LOC117303932 [Asterias rubens]
MFCSRAAAAVVNKFTTAWDCGFRHARYKPIFTLSTGHENVTNGHGFSSRLLSTTRKYQSLLQVRGLPCRRRGSPTERRLCTTHGLLKKDGDKTTGRLPPGDPPKTDQPTSILPGHDDQKPMVFSPANVQVFADPTMAQTVRDVSVDIQKLKGHIQFMKEEFLDTSFEVLKLSQGRASIIAALKESRNLSRDNQAAITSLKTEQKKFDQLIVYISKMVARHENHLNDAKTNNIKKIDSLSQSVDHCNVSVRQLKTAFHNQLQVELKKAVTDVKKLHNDLSKLQLEVRFRGREIAELKSKTPAALSSLDKQHKET